VRGIAQGLHTSTPQIHVTNDYRAIALNKKDRMLAPGMRRSCMRVLRPTARSCSFSDHTGQPQPPKRRKLELLRLRRQRRRRAQAGGLDGYEGEQAADGHVLGRSSERSTRRSLRDTHYGRCNTPQARPAAAADRRHAASCALS
jgi:hypothetical protein